MTPAQLEKLRRIDAHLANLLAIAAKRTPGEWASTSASVRHGYKGRDLTAVCSVTYKDREDEANAAFIASCAGSAEAGWKATRAAIDDWLSLYNSTEGYADGAPDASAHDKLCNEVASICRINLQHILAAFPNI